MAMDMLQEKIRKLKCPVAVDFTMLPEHIAPGVGEGTEAERYGRYCRELLTALKGKVPAVRFALDGFSMLPGGMELLAGLLQAARSAGFYIFLDGPELHSPWAAQNAARRLSGADALPFDALILSPYLGGDVLTPFLPLCQKEGKDLFVLIRSANKSAPELQDLRTGSRLVHGAAADLVARLGGNRIGKSGYTPVGMVVGATTRDCVRPLREKYRSTFLLVDGYDYPGGNGKNCAPAFDRLGRGAVVCAGGAITGAWRESEGDDFVSPALEALERMKRNLATYITVL